MKRLLKGGFVAGLAVVPVVLLAQTPRIDRSSASAARRSFEKATVEGQPIDTRPPELTAEPAFPGQTRAPYRKTADVAVSTIASDLDGPWALAQLPSGRFLVTERAGRIRILNEDGSTVHLITANLPPIEVRGPTGLLDVALDAQFASNNRIYFTYMRRLDAANCAMAVASATLDEGAGTLADVTTIFQAEPFSNEADHNGGSRIAIDPQDGTLFVTIGDRSMNDPILLQAQQAETYLGKVIHIAPDGEAAPGNPALGLPEVWSLGHRSQQGLAFAPDGRLWETEHGPRGGDELNLIEKGKNYGWPLIVHGVSSSGERIGEAIVARAGLEQPRYYWSPSIAPSGLAFYQGDLFPQWKTSILVGGLSGQALFRLELGEDDTVVNEEALLTELNQRIRDVRVFQDGAVYVLTDGAGGKLLKLTPK